MLQKNWQYFQSVALKITRQTGPTAVPKSRQQLEMDISEIGFLFI